MPVTEAQRHDLYNGLKDVLGDHRADTMMAYLPVGGADSLVTRADLDHLAAVLTARFDRVDARFDRVDARFDGVDARIDGVDARFDGVDARLDGVDARIDRVDKGLTGRIDHLAARVDRVEAVISDEIRAVNRRLDRLYLTLLIAVVGMVVAFVANMILA